MSIVIVDDVLRGQLQNLTGPVHLCDNTGKVLGVVNPVPDPDEYGPLEPQISIEEANRRIASNEPRYSTAEVLAYLEKLP